MDFWFIESFSGILVLKWLIGVKSTEIVQIWSLNYVKWFSIFNWSYDLKKNMAIEMRQDLSSCSSDIRWTIIFTIYHFHSTLVVFIIGFSLTHLQISHWLDSEASSNSRGLMWMFSFSGLFLYAFLFWWPFCKNFKFRLSYVA